MLGNDHPVVALVQGSRAGMMARKDPKGAEEALEEVLRIGRKHFPFGHWAIARTMIEAGRHYSRLGDLVKAEAMFRGAKNMAARCRRPDIWEQARNELAATLRDQTRLEESQKILQEPLPK